MRIGIVSDTHNRVPPGIFQALKGVDEILHAGDICRSEILTDLEGLAPVTAVHGNCDDFDLVSRLPEERRLERCGVTIVLLHGHRLGRGRVGDFQARFRDDRPDLVVFGHSHEPLSKVRDGVRYFNPGTAGGIGNSPSVGLAILRCGQVELEHIRLA